MAAYRIVTKHNANGTYETADGPATGPSEVEVMTAAGPHRVMVGQKAIDIIDVAGPGEGEFIPTQVAKSWDDTCALVADQVIASLGAPAL